MIEEKLKAILNEFYNNPGMKTKRAIEEITSICKSEIEDACKKQREICAATYFQNPEGLPSKTFEDIMTIIENAPSPLEEIK